MGASGFQLSRSMLKFCKNLYDNSTPSFVRQIAKRWDKGPGGGGSNRGVVAALQVFVENLVQTHIDKVASSQPSMPDPFPKYSKFAFRKCKSVCATCCCDVRMDLSHASGPRAFCNSRCQVGFASLSHF